MQIRRPYIAGFLGLDGAYGHIQNLPSPEKITLSPGGLELVWGSSEGR